MSQHETPFWSAIDAFGNLVLALMFAAVLIMGYLVATHEPDQWSKMSEQERTEFKRQADQNYQQSNPQRSGW